MSRLTTTDLQQLLKERLRAMEDAERALADVAQAGTVSAPIDVIRAGRGSLVKVAEHILSLESALAASERVLTDLESRANAIRRVVTLIDDVAGETQLIALNAKILAAQAGQEGAGFGVVATKLMELASNSRAATSEVAVILGALANESVLSGEAVRGSLEKVREGALLADRANDAFDALAGILTDNAKDARRLASRLQSLSKRREEVDEAATELAAKLQ